MHNFFWWRDKRYGYNFGDEIVPYLIKHQFNINQDQPCNKKQSNILVSIGSLLWMSMSDIEFWGTGILSMKDEIKQPKNIHAVRGLFSRHLVNSFNIDCPQVYGDPAILLSSIYRPKNINKKYKLGIIPHIVDYTNIHNYYKNEKDILIINLSTNNIEYTIDQILSCEKTISSALHGIIVSIVYDIPTRWIRFSNKLYGDGIKFFDFFSTIDTDVYTKFDYRNYRAHDAAYNAITIKDQYINLFNLPIQYNSITNHCKDTLIKNCPIA